ncbi:hypothetical protein [Tellurirhabdus rosea]|uniref:hypothetical protein n=1 Tax=Tellurirhabdus rosea TaxID=2674997 RepID=UPI0022539168|nr:hypothetical protein [Tellurirhabdus rosea]
MEQPRDEHERGLFIARLLELIQRTTAAIARHQAIEEADRDRFAIQQYTELRERYLEELTQLLEDAGLDVHLHVRQAA